VRQAVTKALSAGQATITIRTVPEKDDASAVFVNDKELFGWTEIALDGPLGGQRLQTIHIPNLIKNTIFAATQKLNKPWCISVFKDNAGVIEFDDTHAVCFKVETHNHPSALDPYGGAGTGIGGVIRDPMGTGMGAFPVANTDVFCFGPSDMPLAKVPKGVLHPRRVMRGVVAGVRDYGNRMGIPTVNGAVYFDPKYVGNPLVFCGTVGLLPRNMCFKDPRPGDAILVVGGRTGRDGIHGATFSSGELTHEHETEFSGAVQIGNAITEKKMLDTIIQARDAGLYNAITDCGAGGLSSAVGEMGEELGAEVHLDRVPLKYAGLSYYEIWISEAQERMVLAVPPEKLDAILKVFADEGVEATVIGHFGSGSTGVPPVLSRTTATGETPVVPPKCPMTTASTPSSAKTFRMRSTFSCGTESTIRSCASEIQISAYERPAYLSGTRSRWTSAPSFSPISPTALDSPPAPQSVIAV
jgi:selenophosphate synthetase-related protein